MRGARLVATLVGATLLTAASPDAGATRGVDPVGTWSCVLYGHPELGEERLLLQFSPVGFARLARVDGVVAWLPLGDYRAVDDELEFADPQTGRSFVADLRRSTLRGSWRTLTAVGGWWCSAIDGGPLPIAAEGLPKLVPLVPRLTATPIYPRRALRDAREGRAVACFFVAPDGAIVDPELIELSNEVFRAPVLEALGRSRYAPLPSDEPPRPSCRTYTFDLDSLLGSGG